MIPASGKGHVRRLRKITRSRSRYGKFHNVHTVVDNIKFASKAEAAHYVDLKQLERSGIIQNLKCHTAYPLIVNGMLICKYVDDFSYDQDGQRITVDVKSPSTKTPTYRLKKKLMLAIHNIPIHEVMATRKRSGK